jgi:Na+-transporting NADH:ubiquinone oxidoreductase subunit NqrD
MMLELTDDLLTGIGYAMRNVVLALLPLLAFFFWQYGLSVLALTVVVTGTCLATERFFNWMSGSSSTLPDWSATITGLLLALVLPPSFPLWMGAVAAFVSIALGMGLGFSLGLFALGSVREIMGAGKLFGFSLFGPDFQPWVVMVLPPGGFFVLGPWLLLFNWLRNRKSAEAAPAAGAKGQRT